MSKKTKAWFIIATVLSVGGFIMFAVVMTVNNWDFRKLSTVEYESNSYEISQEFSNISINTNTADIAFLLADDGKCRVECYEEEKLKHSVAVEDGTLTVKLNDQRNWYDNIGINFDSSEIKIFLPTREYDAVSVKASTSDLDLKNLNCKSFTTTVSTGNIILSDVIATEKISVTTSTGDICFDKCDATEVFAKTSTGDVVGSLFTEKMFTTKTSTGEIDVPKSVSGGKCEIETSTGDIEIKIEK